MIVVLDEKRNAPRRKRIALKDFHPFMKTYRSEVKSFPVSLYSTLANVITVTRYYTLIQEQSTWSILRKLA